MKKILFRCDGSSIIGVGHLVRCSALAAELHGQGCEVHLAMAASHGLPRWPMDLFSGRVHELPSSGTGIEDQGEPLPHAHWLASSQVDDASRTLDLINENLQGSVDWIVVDHYALDSRWHRAVSSQVQHVMAVDDLADRQLAVQIVLDQNREPGSGEQAYGVLTDTECRLLMGPGWALVRPRFQEVRRPFRPIEGPPRVLLMSGGLNSSMIIKCLDAMVTMEQKLDIDIIVGSSEAVMDLQGHAAADWHGIHIHVAPPDPAAIMAQADLAVSAAGSTVWELACLGVPALLVPIAENQIPVLKQAVDSGAAYSLEFEDQSLVRQSLEKLLGDEDLLSSMTDAGHRLVDGLGASRIADLLLKS